MPRPTDYTPPSPRKKTSKPEKVANLREWLESKQGISYDYQRDSWLRRAGERQEPFSWQDVLDLITLYASRETAQTPAFRMALLNEWSREEQKAYIGAIQERILDWIPEPLVAAEMWDQWIYGICDDGHELSQLIMQHWVWQIRRKLLGMPVTDHVCPIFTGDSGCGKSWEIRKLIEPLNDLSVELTMQQLVDERHYCELSRHYIIFLDELAGAKKADRDALKALITANYMSSHIFHSQRREHSAQNATLIGSSNTSVQQIIRDSTSGRRYWEVRCRGPQMDWARLDSIDRRVLWGSIDPLAQSPLDRYPKAKRRIIELQDKHIRSQEPIEIWARERGIEPGEYIHTTATLYDRYGTWCAEQRMRVMNKDMFAKSLKYKLKLPKARTKTQERAWKLSKKSI